MSLIDVGLKAVKAAVGVGAEHAEVFLSRTHSTSVVIEKNSLKHAYTVSDEGLSVKAVYKGSVGFSYTTNLVTRNATKTAELASAQARAGTPDPDFKSLPEPKGLPQIKDIYDKDTAEIDPADIIDIAIRITEAQKIDKRIYSVNSTVKGGWQRIAVVNSLGVECEDKSTIVYAYGETVAKKKGEMASGFELQTSRKFGELDPQWVGRTSAEHAVKSLFGKKIETATLPIVLDPIATGSVFLQAIMLGANAENIQYKRSYLCDKLGEEIGSNILTIIDDGTYPGGAGSFRFDMEGTPSQKVTVIEKGALKNYLYDCYTANKEGKETTGNAIRPLYGRMFPDYRGTPQIGVRNLIVQPGKGSTEDLVSEIKNGIMLRATWDRPNIATGEFSGLISDGYKIEDGEIRYATKQTNIGINMIDFFKRIEAVAADSRQFFMPFRPYSIIAPAITIGKATVSGGQ